MTSDAYRALDWVRRTYTPAWLDIANLNEESEQIRACAPITDEASDQRVNVLITTAATKVAQTPSNLDEAKRTWDEHVASEITAIVQSVAMKAMPVATPPLWDPAWPCWLIAGTEDWDNPDRLTTMLNDLRATLPT